MINCETPLEHKINDGMERLFDKHFPGLPYPEAIRRFAEISAAYTVYGGLQSGALSEASEEYLLLFNDPLSLVAKKWRKDGLAPKIDYEIETAVEFLRRDQAEQYEPLDPDFAPQSANVLKFGG